MSNIAQIQDKQVLYVSAHEDFIPPRQQCTSNWVTLNVGGKVFTTTKRTLTMTESSSMLARMFSEDSFLTPSNQDNNGAFLIDRSPVYFEPILNYLRCGQLVYDKHLNPEGILEEARFFGVQSIIPVLEQIITQEKVNCDEVPLTRRDVVDAIIKTSAQTELRFQGVNLSGADLSRLDLRNINFKYANLQGCNLTSANLSGCCLERADLTNANLDNAQLLGNYWIYIKICIHYNRFLCAGVKSLCANMSGVSMKNSNFRDPIGTRANMEGVNLSAANLEGSYMFGVNLRVANLKKANLTNCDLRGAVLAGANLEVSKEAEQKCY